MDHAYSILEVKSLDRDERVIRGIASTPTLDRVGDSVDPMGARFRTPMPLFMHHDSRLVVGSVTFAQPNAKGIPFEAHIPKIEEPGTLKDRVDEAWQSVKYKLITAVSIGFKPVAGAIEQIKGGGVRFKEWEWLELSLVPVPANAEATISYVKSLDHARLAASGREQSGMSPGASGISAQPRLLTPTEARKAMNMKTLQDLRENREQKAARMNELVQSQEAESRKSTESEASEFDSLEVEVKELDDEIRRMKMVLINAAKAQPIDGSSAASASSARAGVHITSKSNLPKGTAFTRYAMAMANGRGSVSDALKFAERWNDSTPEVTQYIKAVAGGTTTWGAPLAQAGVTAEFLELLRAETFLGKIQGFRRAMFNTPFVIQSGASTIGWVGEAASKPVGELAFTTATIGIKKVAGIVVLTDEQVKVSTPEAEAIVRTDLVAQCAKFLDQQFIDPTVTATAARPASITNGSTLVAPSGTTATDFRADLRALRAAFRAANISLNGAVLLMDGLLAGVLTDMVNPLGQQEFNSLNVNGGSIGGTPVIVSDNANGMIVLLKPSEIIVADDGQVTLDASREATLDMAGGDAPVFNLWQKNCVGIRAERMINWQKARPASVAYIAAGAYVA